MVRGFNSQLKTSRVRGPSHFLVCVFLNAGGQEPHGVRGHGTHRPAAPQGSDRPEPDQDLQERRHGVRVHREGHRGDRLVVVIMVVMVV